MTKQAGNMWDFLKWFANFFILHFFKFIIAIIIAGGFFGGIAIKSKGFSFEKTPVTVQK